MTAFKTLLHIDDSAQFLRLIDLNLWWRIRPA
jgi:hypothetical protein